ncbi:type VI secretion system-associated protein TagF [Enterovirga aerilata]|uniref:Type VI secretion system-associated protein TagF n=1 Tax=Enterovirga aerilata TaxID=2730920 RepID=A0A849IB68_9HYPH|nr:type VI secretion system-associated protein TagF [Enterovirga sp. DB1703]NNM74648.1 type VI secretion system-associated protein TagF [Enterovirga sp. DB1703]
MRCGLYGKLPSKRDFIAITTPKEFLSAWEPWLQGGISASRMKLGSAWQDAFLRAPIWRFWLGGEICGGAVLGAIMPSVDGVGRYFPLTIFARAEPGDELPPPEMEAYELWLEQAENLLLSALNEETSFEALSTAFERFAAPQPGPAPPLATEGLVRTRDGTVVANASSAQFGTILADLRRLDHARLYGSATFWWTLGGEGFAPQVIVGRRMPDPYLYTGMLTGRFDETL